MTHPSDELLKTPLHDLHLALGARMVPFAGYSMPVQYPAGLLAEHHQGANPAGLDREEGAALGFWHPRVGLGHAPIRLSSGLRSHRP